MVRTLSVRLLAVAAVATAHNLDPKHGPQFLVEVWIHNDGSAVIWTIRPDSVDEESATQALEKSLGCELL